MGFGCTTTNSHINDVTDFKYQVYRLSNENELASTDTIELLDSSDEETENNLHQNGRGNVSINHEDSEDECPSADEMDVKPDIHALMRKVQEGMKIKEEVAWNCYEYDRQGNQTNQENDTAPIDDVDLDTFDMESEIYIVEPPQKRQRTGSNEFGLFSRKMPETSENQNSTTEHSEVQAEIQNVLGDLNLNIASEYQMSDATLKEKVKLVQRSRGQQLAIDMLIAAQSKGKPKGATATVTTNAAAAAAAANGGMKAKAPLSSPHPNNPTPSTSKVPPKVQPPPEIPLSYGNDHENCIRTVDELKNDFISEITKWEYKWIESKNLNPLQYKMNIRHLETDFTDLHTFQQFVLDFSLLHLFQLTDNRLILGSFLCKVIILRGIITFLLGVSRS